MVQRVAMDEVLRKHVGGRPVQLVAWSSLQVLGEHSSRLSRHSAMLSAKQLDAVDAHQAEEGVMTLLEVGLAELELDGRELASEDRDQEVARSRRLVPGSGSRYAQSRLSPGQASLRPSGAGVNTSPWSATLCLDLVNDTRSGYLGAKVREVMTDGARGRITFGAPSFLLPLSVQPGESTESGGVATCGHPCG